TRWAWTVVRTSVPFATAQVESFELADTRTGARVRWTLALEPRLLARLGGPFVGRTIARVLHRAMDDLGVYLPGRWSEGGAQWNASSGTSPPGSCTRTSVCASGRWTWRPGRGPPRTATTWTTCSSRSRVIGSPPSRSRTRAGRIGTTSKP